jgi:hypothetical protein
LRCLLSWPKFVRFEIIRPFVLLSERLVRVLESMRGEPKAAASAR